MSYINPRMLPIKNILIKTEEDVARWKSVGSIPYGGPTELVFVPTSCPRLV